MKEGEEEEERSRKKNLNVNICKLKTPPSVRLEINIVL